MRIDLERIYRGPIRLDRQVRRPPAHLEAPAETREDLAAAPLPKSDVLALLQGEVDFLVSQGPALLEKTCIAIANRPGKRAGDWQGLCAVTPGSAGEPSPPS